MKIFYSNSKNPYVNISLEELLLKDENIKEDILFIWQNENTIFFGRNQNIHEEINSDFVKDNNISLVRRLSGGGAVYHDDGNINFTFITSKDSRSYEKFLEPIIEFLQSLGLQAKFKGKNDLEISGYKISGNAQYVYKDRMFHHGTLLFDANLEMLSKALKPNKLKLESKGIKSAAARVTNIKTLLSENMTSDEFKNSLISFFENANATKAKDLDFYNNDLVHQLSTVRKSHDWNYRKNPEFNVMSEKRFNGGTIKVSLNVLQNKITNIIFTGDFLSNNDFENIVSLFINKEFEDQSIKNVVNSIEDFNSYFGLISKEEIIDLILGKE